MLQPVVLGMNQLMAKVLFNIDESVGKINT